MARLEGLLRRMLSIRAFGRSKLLVSAARRVRLAYLCPCWRYAIVYFGHPWAFTASRPSLRPFKIVFHAILSNRPFVFRRGSNRDLRCNEKGPQGGSLLGIMARPEGFEPPTTWRRSPTRIRRLRASCSPKWGKRFANILQSIDGFTELAKVTSQ